MFSNGANFSGVSSVSPSAPIFSGADNGLSIDPVSGHVVLGNKLGDPPLAALLDDRDILLSGFRIRFSGSEVTPGFGAWIDFESGQITIANNADDQVRPKLLFTDNGGGTSNSIEYDGSLLLGPDGFANVIVGNGVNNTHLLQVHGSAFDFSHLAAFSIVEVNTNTTFSIINGGANTNISYGSALIVMAPGQNTIAMPTSNVIIGDFAPATARLELAAGTTAASTAPLKFRSGALNTTAEVGAIEMLTDKLFFTITTGAARKEITLNDIALTAGRVPFVTTNGRLTNDAALTFGTSTQGPSLGISGTITGGAPVATLSITETWNTTGAPVVLSMNITDTASQTFNTFLQRAIVSGTTVWSVRKDGALTTGNPGSGSGIWKLGTVVAGAVVLDATNYVEVEVDGNVVKLLIST